MSAWRAPSLPLRERWLHPQVRKPLERGVVAQGLPFCLIVATLLQGPGLLKVLFGSLRGYAGEISPPGALDAVSNDGNTLIIDIRCRSLAFPASSARQLRIPERDLAQGRCYICSERQWGEVCSMQHSLTNLVLGANLLRTAVWKLERSCGCLQDGQGEGDCGRAGHPQLGAPGRAGVRSHQRPADPRAAAQPQRHREDGARPTHALPHLCMCRRAAFLKEAPCSLGLRISLRM